MMDCGLNFHRHYQTQIISALVKKRNLTSTRSQEVLTSKNHKKNM